MYELPVPVAEAAWPTHHSAPLILPVYNLAKPSTSSNPEEFLGIPYFVHLTQPITKESMLQQIVLRSSLPSGLSISQTSAQSPNISLRKGRSEVNPSEAGTLSVQYGGSNLVPWNERLSTQESDASVQLEAMDILCAEWSPNSIAVDPWNTFKPLAHPSPTTQSPVLEPSPISIYDCLAEFTKTEHLEGENLWYCSKCQTHQPATKNLSLWKVPDILVIHLKRFSSLGTVREKIDAMVDFPVKGLNLEDMVGETQLMNRLGVEGVKKASDSVYDLFAVSEHVGSLLRSGHYKAYAHNREDDQWYHFADDVVDLCEDKDAVVRTSYLGGRLTASMRLLMCYGDAPL